MILLNLNVNQWMFKMSKIALAIAPNTDATLTVLGVTPSQVVLSGQDGKTQSFEISEHPKLAKVVAGDVVTVEAVAEGSDGTYLIIKVAAPATVAKSAQAASRPCNAPTAAHLRNEL